MHLLDALLAHVELRSQCQICHAWPSQTVCGACVQRFAQPTRRCSSCALPLLTTRCTHCASHPSPLDACLAAVSYGFPWAALITRLKFQEDYSLAKPLAQLMRHTPWVEPALEAANCLIPMPLSITRLRERGFNQAMELARHLAPHKTRTDILLRHNADTPQVGASRTQRLARVRTAFWIAPQHVADLRGQRVILLDDVMTTGATLYAAARALRNAGAAHITALVLARTPPTSVAASI